MALWNASVKQVFTRSYVYDELNRLSSMSGAGGNCTGLAWTYDIWANRKQQNVTGGSCGTPQQGKPPTFLPEHWRLVAVRPTGAGTELALAVDIDGRILSLPLAEGRKIISRSRKAVGFQVQPPKDFPFAQALPKDHCVVSLIGGCSNLPVFWRFLSRLLSSYLRSPL